MDRLSGRTVAAIAAVVVLVALFFLRPMFHGLVMFFWTQPLSWMPPLIVLVIGLGILAARSNRPGGPTGPVPAGRETDPRFDPVQPRFSRRKFSMPQVDMQTLVANPALIVVLGLAFLAFLAGSIAIGPLTTQAFYGDVRYQQIPQLPEGGFVRVVPKDVAEQSASSGFNSPTERLSDFNIVRTAEGLEWTALRTPESTVRVFTKKSQGIASLDAGSSARELGLTNAEFRYAPGLQITDNLSWQLLKRRYLIELADPVAIRNEQGEPLILVPYISHRGFPTRRPKLGGAFLVAADGTIEDLSPEAALERPEVAQSGRLFPPDLARAMHDAYAYKNGIWNKLFLHEEQTQISDTETNPQPYLVDFGEDGAKWVTVAEPYGRAFAANAIFLTDAATGETQIWTVPPGESFSGNRRAVQTVRSLTIPGVVFADPAARSAGGGRFRVVEPRPVFVDGDLVYLVSIIPEQANAVSKTVVVDAANNKSLAIFDNDSDPQADEKIARFLRTGEVSQEDAEIAEDPARLAESGQNGDTPADANGSGDPGDVSAQLEELIERQREVLRDTEELREALEAQ